MKFANRTEAGKALATKLTQWAGRDDVVVLGLPRGGVPVAVEVARELRAPVDIFVVRKLGVPGQEELAMGAIASGGTRVLNYHVVQSYDIPEDVINSVTMEEQNELRRREEVYRGTRGTAPIKDKVVILVDDGIATGSTMRAAASAIRDHKPKWIVVAAPVGAASACDDLRAEVDEMACVESPMDFRAVGLWYDDFSQLTDEDVHNVLAKA